MIPTQARLISTLLYVSSAKVSDHMDSLKGSVQPSSGKKVMSIDMFGSRRASTVPRHMTTLHYGHALSRDDIVRGVGVKVDE